MASGRADEGRFLSLHSGAQKQRLVSFSFSPFFRISSPVLASWAREGGSEGRTPLWGRKESNLKVEGVELIYVRNGRIGEENKEKLIVS